MSIYYTSDLHIGHERISALAGRPFASVAEMNAIIRERWCKVVTPDDTVVIVGDLAMGPLYESLDFISTFPGLKILVPGNHDRVSRLYHGSDAKKREWAVAYRDAGIRVTDENYLTRLAGRTVRVCHFPYDGDSHDEDRYKDARPVRGDEEFLIHGHTHSTERRRGRQLHVGVDAWDMTPVSEDVLHEMMYTYG